MYQTLAEKIENVLESTSLTPEERVLLMQSYLQPGITEKGIEKGMLLTEHLVEDMLEKGMLLRKRQGRVTQLYPMPLTLLFNKYQDRTKNKIGPEECLHSIEQWIKYPLLRSPATRIKSSQDQRTVICWLFELHSLGWERVFCFGDYESFIETIGIETEQEWIKERTQKKRCASVIATQDGKWAQHIRKLSKQELRDCLIDPKDFTDMFILAFPEIHTTVIGSSDKEVTFIHSTSVTNTYSELVERCLVK